MGEYEKEEILAFEKEVLGVYISGHPLDDYEELWRKNITATAADFIVDEETEKPGAGRSESGDRGMVAGKTVKTTRTSQLMAFITLEDLMGSVEVIVFPRDYEAHREFFVEDEKLFIHGRVSIGDDPVGKLVCEQAVPFGDAPRELWLQFENMADYKEQERQVLDILEESEGKDRVIIYLKMERAKKILPPNWNVCVTGELVERLNCKVGEKMSGWYKKSLKTCVKCIRIALNKGGSIVWQQKQ